jgi:hypothetical protein
MKCFGRYLLFVWSEMNSKFCNKKKDDYDPSSDDGRPVANSSDKLDLLARKLCNEILFLPSAVVAAFVARGGGCRGESHCRLRFGENGG